jgi:hypothetical protein
MIPILTPLTLIKAKDFHPALGSQRLDVKRMPPTPKSSSASLQGLSGLMAI